MNYLWDDAKAAKLSPAEHLVYRSNLLGSDQRITNTGGGNTSAKLMENDPLTGRTVEVLWVKGSGGDLRTSNAGQFRVALSGQAARLQPIYAAMNPRGPKTEAEDHMVGCYPHCTFNLNPRASSIDTPLHSFIPAKHVDHMHPNSVIAVAASRRSQHLTQEIFGDEVAWTPWLRPGFELGLELERMCKANPKLKGIVMGQHGLINWADDNKECYDLTLRLIEKAAEFIEARDKGEKTFGGAKYQTLPEAQRNEVLYEILPWLRGQVSKTKRFIGTVQSDAAILRFVNSHDAPRLAELGTSCPDHFLRTKIKPLYVDWNPQTEDRGRAQGEADRRSGAIPQGLRGLLREVQAAELAGDARSEPDGDPDPRHRHDRVGQGQERIARDGRVLQLRGGSDARRRSDRRIHRAAAAGSVRHRILAARRSQAEAHAAGEGTGAQRRAGGGRGQRHRQSGGASPGERGRARRLRRSRAWKPRARRPTN